MPRKGTKIDDVGIAIGELLGVPAVQRGVAHKDQAGAEHALVTMNDVKPADRIEHVLNDLSVQALFNAVPPSTWVSTQVAATYCQCSSLTFERRMADRWNTPTTAWRDALEGQRPPAYRPTGMFRWSFVQQMQRAHEERPARRRGPQPKVDPLVAAFARRYRFLVEADQETVVAGWGQAHLTVDQIIAVIDSGGGLKELTVVEALARRWRDSAARAPWQRGMTEVLAAVARAIAQGDAASQALALAETLRRASPVRPRTTL